MNPVSHFESHYSKLYKTVFLKQIWSLQENIKSPHQLRCLSSTEHQVITEEWQKPEDNALGYCDPRRVIWGDDLEKFPPGVRRVHRVHRGPQLRYSMCWRPFVTVLNCMFNAQLPWYTISVSAARHGSHPGEGSNQLKDTLNGRCSVGGVRGGLWQVDRAAMLALRTCVGNFWWERVIKREVTVSECLHMGSLCGTCASCSDKRSAIRAGGGETWNGTSGLELLSVLFKNSWLCPFYRWWFCHSLCDSE